MLSFGTCNRNRGGFTVCAVKILVVVFIPKRTRFQLPFICCGGHFDSFSGNSLVYLIVLFRQKFPLVSVIVVVGLANLSCFCDHYVANKPDKKM